MAGSVTLRNYSIDQFIPISLSANTDSNHIAVAITSIALNKSFKASEFAQLYSKIGQHYWINRQITLPF